MRGGGGKDTMARGLRDSGGGEVEREVGRTDMIWSKLWNAVAGRRDDLAPPSPPLPTVVPAPLVGWRREPGSAAGPNRFDLIAQGEHPAPEIHEEAAREEPMLELDRFSLWFGPRKVLHQIRLIVPKGKTTALVGPSGCGKTSLLRSVNRLNDVEPTMRKEGDVRLAGESIFGPSADVIDLRRRVAMVFQKPNLFPMTVFENVVYPLRVDGERRREVLESACERSLKAAALWQELGGRLHDSALSLSLGQQQRLCIARALAADPELLLLDEPCAALDPAAAGKIEDLLHEIQTTQTILLVTHNIQQASRTSAYTALMYLGHILEFGPTDDIFTRPRLKETEDYISGRYG